MITKYDFVKKYPFLVDLTFRRICQAREKIKIHLGLGGEMTKPLIGDIS